MPPCPHYEGDFSDSEEEFECSSDDDMDEEMEDEPRRGRPTTTRNLSR